MPDKVWTDAHMAQLVALRREGQSFSDLALLTGETSETVRCRLRRYLGRTNDGEAPEEPLPELLGPMASDVVYDPEEVWRQLEEASRQHLAARKRPARITFGRGPVCIVHCGDLHLGGRGVDYAMAREHGEIIADTPGMHLLILGDLLDNFILRWCMAIRMGEVVSTPAEWAAVEYWLRLVGPKILGAISGNHDNWTKMLAGIDYFKEAVAKARPGALYASDDLRFVLDIGGAEWPYRGRHKWRGNSIYNVTHAIERAHKWDQNFIVGVGAHTHTGAFHRTFNAAGREGLAVQVGTYKLDDDYAEREGFARNNNLQAVAVIYRADGSFSCTTNLDMASETMHLYYKREV